MTPSELTLRELEIVAAVRTGKSNKEIAHELGLTEGTIKDYLHKIFRKMGVRNRTTLALKASPLPWR